MELNRNNVLIYISIFCITFCLVAGLVALTISFFTMKRDITDLEVTYSDYSKGDVAPEAESEKGDKEEKPIPQFKSDLTSYEEYMAPEGDEYLILVNAEHRLDSNYIPQDLVPVINTRNDRADREMRLYAAKALEALFIEAEANGMLYVNPDSEQILSVMSAYRSYNEQNYLHEQKKLEFSSYGDKAGEMAATIVQYPGASEHQTGLCCDMHNISSADVSFKNQQAAVWLEENCYKFGFILRYPEDKTEVTGVSYEPWHFRYVGRYHATKMKELDMCLEEYWTYLGK